MDILDHVIESCVPPEWVGVNSAVVTRADYQAHRYHLIKLSEGDEEYVREIAAFEDGDMASQVGQIQRVQNPYQLGRFLLRKEQKIFRGYFINELKYYHPLRDESQLSTALEHNMDVRRYGNAANYVQMEDRNPKFYRTPRLAFDTLKTSYNSCQYILVCKVLGSGCEGDTVSTRNDTEHMPIYVVKLV